MKFLQRKCCNVWNPYNIVAIHVSNSKVQNYQESGGVIYSNLNVTLQGYLDIKMKWNVYNRTIGSCKKVLSCNLPITLGVET